LVAAQLGLRRQLHAAGPRRARAAVGRARGPDRRGLLRPRACLHPRARRRFLALTEDRPGSVEVAGAQVVVPDEDVEPAERSPRRAQVLVAAQLEQEPPRARGGLVLLALLEVGLVVVVDDSRRRELAVELELATELLLVAEQPVQREPVGARVLQLD